jgi:class 3 adenylate cyclase
VTFLLTDIEGSTALFRRLGAGYEGVLADHRRLVRNVVGHRRGVEVKTEGDAFLLAFGDPCDALAAALGIQRAVADHSWPEEAELRLRMGLHRGEAKVVDDDYVSLALHQAARIVTASHGGQVLASSAVVEAVGGGLPEGTALVELGTFQVRDFEDPQRLHQLSHPHLPASFPPPRVPPAVPVAREGLSPLMVGRGAALQQLLTSVPTGPPAHGAGPEIALVVGDGGIGKSRLVAELRALVPPATSVLIGQAATGTPGRPYSVLLDAVEPKVAQWSSIPPDLVTRQEGIRLLLGPIAPGLAVGDDDRRHRSDEVARPQ